jgi:hypothetical protein
MAHYAKLDENNIVTDVIVIANKDCLDGNGNECEEPGRRICETLTGHANWKKTSYNTRMGVYYDSNTGAPSEDQSKAYRLNYAQVGMKYDVELNGFVVTSSFLPKRHPKMTLNPQTGYWALPRPNIPLPTDLQLEQYPLEDYFKPWFWFENEHRWIKLKRDEPVPGQIYRFEEMI